MTNLQSAKGIYFQPLLLIKHEGKGIPDPRINSQKAIHIKKESTTFSLRLSTWECKPIIRTPCGINSSLFFKVAYESVLPDIDFSISLSNTIKGPLFLSSSTT